LLYLFLHFSGNVLRNFCSVVSLQRLQCARCNGFQTELVAVPCCALHR
jgi:hypothetical protein